MPTPPQSVCVLLSDLHFGRNLLGETLFPPLDVARGWRILGANRKLEQWFRERCAAHDLSILKALPRYLTQLLLELRASGYRKEQFDLFVLLGDLATWADQPTYEFLTNYLCANEVQESDSLSTHKVRGLAISQERLIAIPGNHDKMLRRDLSLYFEGFTRRTGLPDAPQPQQCYLVSKTIDDREMLFIQLEASIYGEEALRLDTAAIGLLARGKVTVAARDEIDRKLTALKSGETVDSAEISSYANAWKVLVVHYSPDILATTGKRDPAELVIPHECAGLSELVRELRDDIHVVLHGHLHYPAVYNLHGVPVVSVGTVTQLCREPRKNGFFLLKCFESGEVLTEHHVWHGTGFLQDSNPTLERPLR